MLEPILAKWQKQLYKSVLDNLVGLLGNHSTGGGGGSSFQPRASEFDGLIASAAARYDLDQNLLKAVVQAESNFSPTATSHAGAKGLMQLMDATAQQLGVTNSYDPVENIEGGARFLRQMLNRYNGNELLALAAYNAGPGAVDKWGGLPPYSETQAYVPRILNLRDKYRQWSA